MFMKFHNFWIQTESLLFQVMEKGYKRLTPEQPVGLRHAGYIISFQKVIKVRHSSSFSES